MALVAACGLDAIGRLDPSAGADAADTDGDVGFDEEAGGPVADGSLPDVAVPETCTWPALERNAAWPMIGGCVRHPGRTVHRGPKSFPTLMWKVTVTTREPQPVVGADGTIYVPANTSGLVAFLPDGGPRPFPDSGTGSRNNVTNVPSIGRDGTLFFGVEKSVVAHGPNGTRWRTETGGEVDNSVLVDEDGTVYAGSSDDSLYAFGPDGGVRWKVDLGGVVWAAAALGSTGAIYVGADNRLYALERDGGESWRFQTTGNIQSSPVVADDGTVYIGTTGSRLHAVAPDGGARWAFTTKGGFGWQQLPALGKDGTIYTATGSTLAAIAPDGGMKWEHNAGVQLRTSVVVDADGIIYVGGSERMFAYDADGQQLWSFELGANAFGFAIGQDGTIYVACDRDTLLALHE